VRGGEPPSVASAVDDVVEADRIDADDDELVVKLSEVVKLPEVVDEEQVVEVFFSDCLRSPRNSPVYLDIFMNHDM
jgi:hypothetical protein